MRFHPVITPIKLEHQMCFPFETCENLAAIDLFYPEIVFMNTLDNLKPCKDIR